MTRRILILFVVAVYCIAVPFAVAAKNQALADARSAAENGDWEAVFTNATLATQNVPKNADGWALLARSESFLGDTNSAITHYRTAVKRNPKHPLAVLELTSLYVSRGDTLNADTVVTAAELKDRRGKFDEIKVARALILGRQGKLGEATPILASATGKHPDNPLYPTMLARIYRDAGVLQLAASNYEKAWNLDEGNAELAFEYGQVLLKLKRYDEANRLFKIVQERDPDNKFVDYLRGRLYHAAGRYAEASAEFDKAVTKQPDDFLTNYWLGRSYIDLAKSGGPNVFHLAEAPLRKALELRPEREDVLQELAEAIYQQGKTAYRQGLVKDTTEAFRQERLQVSVDKYLEALSRSADLDEIFAHLARSHDKLGALDSAIYYTGLQLDAELLHLLKIPEFELEDFEMPDLAGIPGLDFNPIPPQVQAMLDSLPLKIATARVSTGNVTRMISLLQRTKNQQGLIDFLAPLMEIEEVFDSYGMILANAYLEAKQYDDSREMLNRLTEQNPDDCDLYQLNAYIDLKRERYCSAVEILLKGVKACPRNTDLWTFLGDSYYFCDEKDRAMVEKARDAYKRACDLGWADGCKKHDQTNQILARLR